ncbi:Lrp/AsnC ligand binding domain-containing protein [Acetobacter suratthaniensis]|uniref:Lrp/AsnC ligand binding domain-containing protein n=1 Tax=Acetobacter suratthaniensis TaxID=1502841 RepID=A0ABS3LNM3_9PROT|nr:winged helix-turn-helix transcriptional regulator [Acetobacter suratthaniensis]MBO1328953.1 Lrp/AsnC ligand binding domain-containing protein [Acetobacter suratthaniensis]MCX2567129.1 Lrp/AsnC ligand binding domain-containing protein [Acetobacter suratthaniensis]
MADVLDRTDRKILRLLQGNGRISNADLAEEVNISPATCHRRLQRLFDEGYVTNVRGMINAEKIDLGTLVLVGVVLDRSTPDSFAEFEAAVSQISSILDCYLVAGDFDYFLKIRVRDMADFNRLHATKLITLPSVRQTRTFFTLKTVADTRVLDF